jgi:hypothetical protein
MAALFLVAGGRGIVPHGLSGSLPLLFALMMAIRDASPAQLLLFGEDVKPGADRCATSPLPPRLAWVS